MSYKHLQRQLRRLPLPQQIITDGSRVLKQHYLAGKTSWFDKTVTIILEEEEFRDLPKMLDFIYKADKPEWFDKFIDTPYIRFKGKWPTVHIAEEVKANSSEYRAIHYTKPLLVTDYLPGKSSQTLPLIKHYSDQIDEISSIVDNVQKMYKFIIKNRERFDVSNLPMDVLYVPSKLGTSPHPISIDLELRDKVKLVKRICLENCPMEKEALQRLTNLVKENPPINKNYYKFVAKLRDQDNTKSLTVRKILRKQEYIPNDQQIYEIIQRYLHQQFYLDTDNVYRLNLKN